MSGTFPRRVDFLSLVAQLRGRRSASEQPCSLSRELTIFSSSSRPSSVLIVRVYPIPTLEAKIASGWATRRKGAVFVVSNAKVDRGGRPPSLVSTFGNNNVCNVDN